MTFVEQAKDLIQGFAWRSRYIVKHKLCGAEAARSCENVYKIASIWQEMNQGGDMMIWRVTPGGDPIKWVRVYEDESIDAVTDDALALLA